MNQKDVLRTKLASWPEIRWTETEDSVVIEPVTESGFSISFVETADSFVVAYDDGWHEEFADPEEAIECVAFGLSDVCRLRVLRRGKTSYNWTVEYDDDGTWRPESRTGLFMFPFWRRREVRYLQNGVLVKGIRETSSEHE